MPIVFNIKTAISLIFAAVTLARHFNSSHHVCMSPSCSGHACCVRVGSGGFELPVTGRAYASKARAKTKRNSYTYIMRTPTSDKHFKDKIVRIILEILR